MLELFTSVSSAGEEARVEGICPEDADYRLSIARCPKSSLLFHSTPNNDLEREECASGLTNLVRRWIRVRAYRACSLSTSIRILVYDEE